MRRRFKLLLREPLPVASVAMLRSAPMLLVSALARSATAQRVAPCDTASLMCVSSLANHLSCQASGQATTRSSELDDEASPDPRPSPARPQGRDQPAHGRVLPERRPVRRRRARDLRHRPRLVRRCLPALHGHVQPRCVPADATAVRGEPPPRRPRGASTRGTSPTTPCSSNTSCPAGVFS